ncbi:hypothetical protein VVD49_07325 [Uliginosibacterium sp. H3]|uniref:DUF2336 domain-containing protein n=1 Tax=Uliginosibacterium silvisoli TaxID=3114758 RepID=A0ABU6K1Q8_9RHOO|nr:hypothetical protein [Uliginosibacterium sp. H3]
MMKEYGKLTREQFQQLVRHFHGFRAQRIELAKAVSEANPERIDIFFKSGLIWAAMYEFPLVELLARLIVGAGAGDWLHDLAKSGDPQQAILDEMDSDLDTDIQLDDAAAPHFLAFIMVAERNIAAIERYHRSMHALVSEAKAGDLDSLCKAVTIDRSVLACPPIAAIITRAQFMNDAELFRKLGRALQGPSKRIQKSLDDVRFVMFALRDFGLTDISDAKLKKLIVEELRIYRHSDPQDATKSLGKQFREAKKYATT